MGHQEKSCSPAVRQRWLAKPGIQESQNAKACLRVAQGTPSNRAKKSQVQPSANSPIPDIGSPSIDRDAISPIPDIGSPSLDCDANSHDPQSDFEDFPFPYNAEQQPVTAITSPPLQHSSYKGDDPALTTLDDFSYEADDSVLSMDNNLPCSCGTPTLQTVENLVGLWWKEWESESMWNDTFDSLLKCTRMKGKHTTTIFFEECDIFQDSEQIVRMSGFMKNNELENFEEGEHFDDKNQTYVFELKLKESVTIVITVLVALAVNDQEL
ncbi:hypothetical protein EDD22DRAFT_852964 [Suillus occidentalis]|nr:hypothetical protein EDD22DRAFT_852964 [Suillus occidentalis]